MDFKLLWNKKGTIGIIVLIFLLLAFILTMLQPLTFGAKAKVLVIQNAPVGSDPYALARSNSYLSVIFSDVVATHAFYEEVMNGNFGAERSYFEKNGNIDKTLGKWKKTVRAVPVGDTGVIEIEAIHPNKEQAKKIVEGTFETLAAKHMLFHGMGDNVQIKIIDPAIVSQKTPNAVINFGGALILGLLVSLAYVFQYPEDKHNLRLKK